MAVKTFTTGEVLTAADTNTYLNNGGLVYVKSQTIGTAVSSVTVNSAFSADFDNYQITYAGGTTSASAAYQFQIGSAVAAYYSSWYYDLFSGSSGTLRRSNQANAWIGNTGAGVANYASWTMFIATPFAATRTTFHGTSFGGGYSGWFGGFQDDATSWTSFTISTSAGTLTGGTLTVYGYRKA